jgi:hypothetical protein
MRQIKFEGDIAFYIGQLAQVCFTGIKNTCEWYMAAFKENLMASGLLLLSLCVCVWVLMRVSIGFVKWSTEQVKAFADMFRRQVYAADDENEETIKESLEVTRSQAAMVKCCQL